MNQELTLKTAYQFSKEKPLPVQTLVPVGFKSSAKVRAQNEALSSSGLLISIVLHLLVLFAFISFQSKPNEPVIKEMPITVSLLSEVPEAPMIENKQQPEPKEIKRKVEPIKQAKPVLNVPSPQPVISDVPVANPVPVQAAESTPSKAETSAVAEVKTTQAAEKEAAKVSEDVDEPPKFGVAYLNNPKPNYPALSRRAGEEGRVLFKVLVNANGEPESVEVSTSSGSERLDNAGLEAVKQWRFVPAKRNNQAMSAYVTVPISFKLD